MKRIYFIRHGRQESRLCNVDVPLSPEGREQAQLLASRLSGMHFDAFYSSRLQRAVETADIINEKLKMPISRRSELNEIDWGDLTALGDQERNERYPSFLEERRYCTSDLPFPGGESGADVFARMRPFMKEVETGSASSILIVSHGGLIRCMIAGLLGLDMKDKLRFGKNLENTGITEFWYDDVRHLYTLERLNDATHLDAHPELLRSGWQK